MRCASKLLVHQPKATASSSAVIFKQSAASFSVFSRATFSRLFSSASSSSQSTPESAAAAAGDKSSSNVAKEQQEDLVSKVHFAPEKPPSAEYHRHSTRYYRCSRDVLDVLDKEWRTPSHPPPKSMSDRVAIGIVRFLRTATDSYFRDRLLLRAVMLETIAACPPFCASMAHHFRSLRQMKHCYWLKAAYAEAENERMHLMTFMSILEPTLLQRLVILGAQGAFLSLYMPSYALFPGTSHRFVSALEVEACHTYTEFLKMIDNGRIENVPAPKIAIDYWNMPEDATLRDVVLAVRADEADHILVNQYMYDSTRDHRHSHDHKHTKACESFEVDLHAPFGPIFLPGHKQYFEKQQAKHYSH